MFSSDSVSDHGSEVEPIRAPTAAKTSGNAMKMPVASGKKPRGYNSNSESSSTSEDSSDDDS